MWQRTPHIPKPYEYANNLEAIKLVHNIKYYTDALLIGMVEKLDGNLTLIKENIREADLEGANGFQRIYFTCLYYQSYKENYYWEYCPFEVYKNSFQKRLTDYLDYAPDSYNRDFYLSELLEIGEIEDEEKIHTPNFDFSNFYCRPKKIRVKGTSGSTYFEYEKPFFKPVIENTQKRKIEFLIGLLNSKEDQCFEQIIEPRAFHSIFKDYGYELFCYLHENYNRDDKSPKAKYSNIFRFLEYENKIIGTQLQYIEFIKKEFDIKMSKIQPPNKIKYSDKIQPELAQLKKIFLSQY